MTDHQNGHRLSRTLRRLRLSSLRVRLAAVFAVVALTAAVSASGIAYWLNRDAVLKRAQNTALDDFRSSLGRNVSALPQGATCAELAQLANDVASSGLNYDVVVVDDSQPGCAAFSDPQFTLAQVPHALVTTVATPRSATTAIPFTNHLYWQRVNLKGDPYLVGGTKVVPTGLTAYMFKSLDNERDDLKTLAWSLAVATMLALVAATLLAQAASSAVLRPVRQLGDAARRLGEGELDVRLEVTGADELADLSRTFNQAVEQLSHQVDELSAREAQSRRFVADMSHELRTPLTAMTAVTDILEDEAESLDPMIEPAVRLVVSETRRLSDLVENLMEVTRFDAGTAKLVADEMDIADLIMSCIDGRAWYDAVEVDAPRGVLAVVDPRRLDVVFANLIGNALKHGGSPVRVKVSQGWDRPAPARWWWRSRTAAPASRRTCCRMSSTGSTRPTRGGPARRAAGSACPSRWPTPRSTAAPSPSPTGRRAARSSPCGCRWSRRNVPRPAARSAAGSAHAGSAAGAPATSAPAAVRAARGMRETRETVPSGGRPSERGHQQQWSRTVGARPGGRSGHGRPGLRLRDPAHGRPGRRGAARRADRVSEPGAPAVPADQPAQRHPEEPRAPLGPALAGGLAGDRQPVQRTALGDPQPDRARAVPLRPGAAERRTPGACDRRHARAGGVCREPRAPGAASTLACSEMAPACGEHATACGSKTDGRP